MHNQELTAQTVDSIDTAASRIVDSFQQNVIAQMALLSESMEAASKVAALTSKLAVRASVLEMVSRSAERVAAMIERLPGDDALRSATYRVMVAEMVEDAVGIMESIGVPAEATRGAMLATFPALAAAVDHKTPTHYHDGRKFVGLHNRLA
jgi:hypothetical protein